MCLSCGERKTTIEGIDWEVWKSDRFGCKLARFAFRDQLLAQRERLKALSEMDIVSLMGKPDQTELFTRNQKFYTYYITRGPSCGTPDSTAQKLVIRFNAVGLAKEVAIQ